MFGWFNSNLFSQILTGAIILETGLTALLMKIGCTQAAADTALVCTTSTLPEWTPAWLLPWLVGAATVQGALKWGLHLFKGDTWLGGLLKPTVVVTSSGAPGTVTMKQVETGHRK